MDNQLLYLPAKNPIQSKQMIELRSVCSYMSASPCFILFWAAAPLDEYGAGHILAGEIEEPA